MNWINTSDSRPADGERVLFWASDGRFHAGEYRVDTTDPHEPPYASWWECGDTWEDSDVTHWQRVNGPEGV